MEIAGMMIAPRRVLSFDEAMAIVRGQMPDETFTVRANVAESLARRSLKYAK